MLEGSATLFDVLAIVIAFSAVMLLLSLLVTSIAQAAQATLRLRARNLQSGLGAWAERELKLPKKGARQLAATLLNSPEIAVLKGRKDPTSLFSRVAGPLVSWVEPEQLREAIVNTQGDARGEEGTEGTSEPGADESSGNELARIDADAAVKRFERMDAPLKKRFAYAMRIVTVAPALAVAVVLQVGNVS